MRILNTDFKTELNENGKKKVLVDGPLAVLPLVAPLVLAFGLGRLTKRR